MTHHLPLNFRLAIIGGLCAFLLSACSAGPAAPTTGVGATPPGSGPTVPPAPTSPAVTIPTLAPGTTSPSEAAVPSSPANPGDPCRLLTSAEAEAALGRAVGPPVTLSLSDPALGNGFDCAYNSVNQEAGPASVHVGVLGDNVPRDGWEQAERAETDLEEVFGVGELAFFDRHNQSIDAFDQGRWIQVQMINSTRFAELLVLLTDIARNAIARI